MTEPSLLVETIENGPFQENCYIVADRATKQAILVDPGDEEERILERVRELGLEVTEIVCTHAHIDHAGAVAPLQRVLGVPFAIHGADRPALAFLPQMAAMFGLSEREVPKVDRELSHGDIIRVGSLAGRVLHTPGHSPGGCCIYFEAQGLVFVGDTLFAGSVGRTDLPGGSTATLMRSIKEQLLTLDDSVRVYCGHMPATTIGAERRGNPFLQAGGSLLF